MAQQRVDELAGGLRTAVNRLAHALRSPATSDGITPTRLAALVTLLKHGPLRPGDLATRLNITAASASRLIDVLLEGDWIRREPDPDDRRASLVSLSPHGAEALDKLRREGTGELAAGIEALPADQRDALAAALPALVALADHFTSSRQQ
ncbi:MAG: MarR family transcriptional regulator [Nocardioides sp.]|uniref:MarR family winged helix-turn-helix transcriptional regulator n=1 Tax=Nocardioides sp. TaxID=35761 RepID=UPI0039E69D9D